MVEQRWYIALLYLGTTATFANIFEALPSKATAIFNRVRKGIHFLRDCEKVSYAGWVLTKKMDILESL